MRPAPCCGNAKVFTIQEKALKDIEQKIRENGYDRSQPLVIWEGKNILLDGHTRLEAIKELGFEEAPVTELEFESMEDALLYTFERQALRRNLAPAEILGSAKLLDRRKKPDGKGQAAKQVAGTSYREAAFCVDFLVKAIVAGTARGGRVELRGLGSFLLKNPRHSAPT
jgi:hypothetical protein